MPREPPKPTDLRNVEEYSVDRCPCCLEVVESQSNHYERTECSNQELTEVFVDSEFGIVVPERSGYLWCTKTDAFAVRQVNIQGTYIPIGNVWSYNMSADNTELPIELSRLDFEGFDNPQEIRRLIKIGFRQSTEHDYGGINLGEKLVKERLDGVYEENEEVKQQKLKTRDERIQSVWSEINDNLPFKYNRVVAPRGFPRTREGLRWIEVTDHNVSYEIDDETHRILFQKPWVESLIEEGPVALYYPNSD